MSRTEYTDALILGAERVKISEGTRSVLTIQFMTESGERRGITSFPELGQDDLPAFMNQGISFLFCALFAPEMFQQIAELAEAGDSSGLLGFLKEEVLPKSKTLAETFLSEEDDQIAELIEQMNGEGGIAGRVVRVQFYERRPTVKEGKEYRNFAIPGFDTRQPNKLPMTPVPVVPSPLDGCETFAGRPIEELIEGWRTRRPVATEGDILAQTAAALADLRPKSAKAASKVKSAKKSAPFA